MYDLQIAAPLKAAIVGLGTFVLIADANAAESPSHTIGVTDSSLATNAALTERALSKDTDLLPTQFMGGRRTNYSQKGRYKGSRTRFSRKRLPKGAASTFTVSKFSHNEKYIGGQGVRITKFDNGFHSGKKIRQRIR
ncbi:MAG: hypothetical protein AAF950_12500 [Pseudomonadota bacterium]